MERSTARTVARAVAWGRVGIGAAASVWPSAMTRPWVGRTAGEHLGGVLARAMAGRDLALGAGTLRALALSDREARPWVALSGLADAADAIATVIAFGRLPRRRRWAMVALTSVAATISIRAAITLDPPPSAAGPETVEWARRVDGC